jgi:hypothetical protein
MRCYVICGACPTMRADRDDLALTGGRPMRARRSLMPVERCVGSVSLRVVGRRSHRGNEYAVGQLQILNSSVPMRAGTDIHGP